MGNKQNLAPLPIGLAVFLAHVVCIPITGCSINPTRSFGPALVADAWDDHWIWSAILTMDMVLSHKQILLGSRPTGRFVPPVLYTSTSHTADAAGYRAPPPV